MCGEWEQVAMKVREKDVRFVAWTTETRHHEVRVTQADGTNELSEYSGKKVGVVRSTPGGFNLALSNVPLL